MSEYSHHPIGLAERLRPDITPEMGFQSYELLSGDSEYRKTQERLFLAGKIRNPHLDYPKLDENLLHRGIAQLDGILSESRTVDDSLAADAIWDTASYRMAEMYWLLEAKRLNELAEESPYSEEFFRSAERYQCANEELYGRPNERLAQQVLGEIITQANGKDLHPSAQRILDEFVNGADIPLDDGEVVTLKGVGESQEGRLPSDIATKLTIFREVLKEDFDDVYQTIRCYWDDVIVPRSVKDELAAGFTVADMKVLFERVHELRDPENLSGITIMIHPGSTQLAWDTPSMSVRIGANRKAITSVDDMFAKIIHEYGVHAGRAVEGLKTDLPILGTGVYSSADRNEASDYLTFEEGFASLAEIAIDGSFTDWKPLHVSRYLAAITAYRGADFRQSFETNWRARVLMTVAPGQEVTDELIEREKTQAYQFVMRLYRGTPTQLAEGPILTFNKDLAYLQGKLAALHFIEVAGKDKELIRRAFLAKIDPMNHYQKDLQQRYMPAV
ncbi:MAG: tyrosine/phenylalanine carboxypeptidase domain-containing protein [Candidatus Saccharimonas sp.]